MYGSRLEQMKDDFIVVFDGSNSMGPNVPFIVKRLELARNTDVGVRAET